MAGLKPLRNAAKRKVADFRYRWLQDWVFVHINKTGGTSVGKALNIRLDHRSALELIEALGRPTWDRKFSFAFVRNPWDKVVSQYHYRARTAQAGFEAGPPPFPEWAVRTFAERDPAFYDRPRMFRPQMDWVADDTGEVVVNFIGRFETLDADFQEVCRRIGRTASLPHLKASPHAPYRTYYDDESRDAVAKHFARDIAAFGYDF